MDRSADDVNRSPGAQAPQETEDVQVTACDVAHIRGTADRTARDSVRRQSTCRRGSVQSTCRRGSVSAVMDRELMLLDAIRDESDFLDDDAGGGVRVYPVTLLEFDVLQRSGTASLDLSLE